MEGCGCRRLAHRLQRGEAERGGMMDRGTVTLSQDEAGAFVVRLDPPDPNYAQDQRFDDIRDARGMMGGVRLVLGRRKIDLTKGEANGKQTIP